MSIPMFRTAFISFALISSASAQNWQPYYQAPQSAYRSIEHYQPRQYVVPQQQPQSSRGGLFEAVFGGNDRPIQPVYAQPNYARPAYRPVYAALPHTPPPQARIEPSVQSFDSRFTPQMVRFNSSHAPGTVIIDTQSKFLHLVMENGQAMRYGVGVGRPGFTWKGVKTISRKAEWPDWRPPAQMLKRRPDLPKYMAGGENNPLGARAMYLGSSLYRIHGTNEPHTIGHNVSSGCFRMRNEDVQDLYSKVRIGTKVVVL